MLVFFLSCPYLSWMLCLFSFQHTSFPLFLTPSLTLASPQWGSIHGHSHADYIMDLLLDRWPPHIKRGLALLLGPSRPISTLIRRLLLLANGTGAILWKIQRGIKQGMPHCWRAGTMDTPNQWFLRQQTGKLSRETHGNLSGIFLS